MVSLEGETPAFNLASFTSVCFDIPEVMNMSKHMTIQDRQDISAGLKAGDSFGSIATKNEKHILNRFFYSQKTHLLLQKLFYEGVIFISL
jgi:hypothetical protein